jgi:predicted nucleotidyltransferase
VSLDVRRDHLVLIQTVLRAHVPSAIVRAFGSRVRGESRPTSDLDLCLDHSVPLSFETLAALRDAFAESNLPYKVDVLDWQGLDPVFQSLIQKDSVVIQGPDFF